MWAIDFGSSSGASEIFKQGNFLLKTMAMYNARWRWQVFTSWCSKIQINLLFTEITVFLMYREIYVHIFMYIYFTVYSILTSVLKKIKQYCLKFHAAWERFFFNQLDCLHVMCSAISVGPRGMVQPIAAPVLKTFTMTNIKDCGIHPRTMLAANSEGIWNNYIYIQDINMQVMFTILLCTRNIIL